MGRRKTDLLAAAKKMQNYSVPTKKESKAFQKQWE
jgi:hypothetical protein